MALRQRRHHLPAPTSLVRHAATTTSTIHQSSRGNTLHAPPVYGKKTLDDEPRTQILPAPIRKPWPATDGLKRATVETPPP